MHMDMDEYEKYERFRRRAVRRLLLVIGVILLAVVSATVTAVWVVSRPVESQTISSEMS